MNQVSGPAVGNQAVIAPGTGLGEAGLFWDGNSPSRLRLRRRPHRLRSADDLQIELFRYLKARFGHVSYERILSGPGLVNVYEFLRDTDTAKSSRELAAAVKNRRRRGRDLSRRPQQTLALWR